MAQQHAKALKDLNVRTAPNPEDPNNVLPPPLHEDEVFELRGNDQWWFHIHHNGREGFVNGTHTQCLADGTTTLWQTKVTAGDGLRVRNAPSTHASILGGLPLGAMIDVVGYEVTGHNDIWLRIKHDNQTGYVFSTFTKGQSNAAEAVASFVAPAPSELDHLMQEPELTADQIRRARASIAGISDGQRRGDLYEALQSKVVYRNQRNNRSRDPRTRALVEVPSGAMCNLTSLAMCLNYLGIDNPKPEMQFEDTLETIRVDNHLPSRTTSSGWGGVARRLGATYSFLGSNVTAGEAWYATHVRPALRAGHGVMMSITGHIVRVQAVTDDGLLVDDPYGKAKLLPGGLRAWRFLAKNPYQTTGPSVGQNVLWSWADVQRHSMLWIAQFQHSSRGDLSRGPEEEFEDDGVCDPEAKDGE